MPQRRDRYRSKSDEAISTASKLVLRVLTSHQNIYPISMGEYIEPSSDIENENEPLFSPHQEDPSIRHATSTMKGSVFTLTNTILGSGTLAVPYAIASSGWVLGNIAMVATAIATWYSVRLLLLASDLAGSRCAKTYESLGHYTMGKYGTWLAEFTFILGGFGTLMSYLIFTSSLFGEVLGISKEKQWMVMVVCVVLITMPLSLYRKIQQLQVTSFLAIVSVAYVVLLISSAFVVYGNTDKIPQSKKPVAINFSSQSVYTITLLIAAFACHNTTLPVYEELRNRSVQRMTKCVWMAITIAFALYEAIGLGGYLLFGENTNPNILLNFDSHFLKQHNHFKIPLLFGQTSMAIGLLFTHPIALWPFRSCLLSVYLRLKTGTQQSSSNASKWEFIATSVLSQMSILFCAIAVPDVKIPLSIVGSVSGSLIIFIMPSLFYMLQRPIPLFSMDNTGPIILFLLGIIIGIVGFSLTIYKIVDPHH